MLWFHYTENKVSSVIKSVELRATQVQYGNTCWCKTFHIYSTCPTLESSSIIYVFESHKLLLQDIKNTNIPKLFHQFSVDGLCFKAEMMMTVLLHTGQTGHLNTETCISILTRQSKVQLYLPPLGLVHFVFLST